MIKDEKKPRQMPKGGRKGGAVFPRVPLGDAVEYAKKLVSKTHTSRQPRDVVYSGVVGAGSGTGDIRISALKQYGFLEGDNKAHFSATQLAIKINSAPDEEILSFYREASLKPKVFKGIFDAFHGDAVSKSKLKQRAAYLKVHPEETEKCVDMYIASLQEAKILKIEDDKAVHIAMGDLSGVLENENFSSGEDAFENNVNVVDFDEHNSISQSEDESSRTLNSAISDSQIQYQNPKRAVFNVNVNLDASLDIDKLERQLKVLKKFGAI